MVVGDGSGVLLRVKVVPGASRDRIVGRLGDRLKLSVAAAPEAGKANKAVCALIAQALAVPAGQVQVVAGLTNPLKTLAILGVSVEHVCEQLGTHLD